MSRLLFDITAGPSGCNGVAIAFYMTIAAVIICAIAERVKK